MLEAICKLLDGLATPDHGAYSQLTPSAYQGLIDLLRSIYGDNAAEAVAKQFFAAGDDELLLVEEGTNPAECLRLALAGKS